MTLQDIVFNLNLYLLPNSLTPSLQLSTKHPHGSPFQLLVSFCVGFSYSFPFLCASCSSGPVDRSFTFYFFFFFFFDELLWCVRGELSSVYSFCCVHICTDVDAAEEPCPGGRDGTGTSGWSPGCPHELHRSSHHEHRQAHLPYEETAVALTLQLMHAVTVSPPRDSVEGMFLEETGKLQ